MLNYDGIKKAMQVDVAMSATMVNAIYKWSKMYENKAPWIKGEIKGLKLSAAIAHEISRLVTLECEISVSGDERAAYLAKQFKPVGDKLKALMEFAAAKGGIVLKPYPDGDRIAIDVVQADNFFPVSFNSAGEITGAIFPEFKTVGKILYTRLEYHRLEDARYHISNKAFRSTNAQVKVNEIVNLGEEIPLEKIPEWEDLLPEAEFEGIEHMLFSYIKIPWANEKDPSSPLGVSVYSRADDLIRDADEQYGQILWEYKSKETAIQASSEFFKRDRAGNAILPAGKERLYTDLGDVADGDKRPFFNTYSPDIRDQSFYNGLNRILQRIEFNCNLAYGTLSDPQTVEKTATEILSSKQRSYSSVKEIQGSLQEDIDQLFYAMNAWADIDESAPEGTYETSYNWDDSIVVDKESERKQDIQDVAIGAMPLWEYRVKWYGEPEAVAKQMIVKQADLIEE